MKGRNTFTKSEIKILQELFKLKDEAGSCEQKKIRDKMRKMGFYITDFDVNMNSAVFDDLIINGRINIFDGLSSGQNDNQKTINFTRVLRNNKDDYSFSLVEKNIKAGMSYVKNGLEPLIDDNCEILILGSFPSDVSIKNKFYYQNKSRNSFWKLIHGLLGDGDDSKEFLLSHHIALWDCLASCNRKGNLDSNISDGEIPNDIPNLLKENPKIKKIVLNGYGKPQEYFNKYFLSLYKSYKIIVLPSSSNACSMLFEDKLKVWKDILK